MCEHIKRRDVWMCGGMAFILSLVALGTSGCGGSGEEGGPPDFPVSAVVAKAERQVSEDRVVVVATLESKDEIMVVSELDATVREIPFEEGQPVNADEVLFQLDDVRTRAELEEAESGFKLAELSYNRNKELLENQTISQQEYDQAEADYYDRKAALALASDQQEKAVIKAPFNGVAAERNVSVGQFVTRGEQLTHLIGTDPLEVAFDVPERKMSKLKRDLAVSFVPDAMPEEQFEGRVTYIAPSVNQRTRVVRVKAEIPNSDGRLKPGMFGEVALVLERREDAVVIPESSIKFEGDTTMIVVVNAEGRAEFRPVTVGQRSKGHVEISDGLAAGEIVVVEGHQKVFFPGMQVMAAPESERYGIQPGPLGSAPAAPVVASESAEGGDANL